MTTAELISREAHLILLHEGEDYPKKHLNQLKQIMLTPTLNTGDTGIWVLEYLENMVLKIFIFIKNIFIVCRVLYLIIEQAVLYNALNP